MMPTVEVPMGLTMEQAGRLLRMARGAHRCQAGGPTREVYRQLCDQQLAYVATTTYPHLSHWLHTSRDVAAKLYVWRDGLSEEGQAQLQEVFELIEEEAYNHFKVINGYPERQTYRFVPRPPQVATPEGEIICAGCRARFVPGASADPARCAECAPILPPTPAGTQFHLFSQASSR